jgi:nucleoside permease NupC
VEVAQSLFGFLVLHVLAWSVSEDRRRVVWRPLIAGMALALDLAAPLHRLPLPAKILSSLQRTVLVAAIFE